MLQTFEYWRLQTHTQYTAEMAHRAVMYFLCVSGVFQEGLTALIQTQQTVMAALGEDACFSCQLMQSKDVHQVTWQKLLPEGEENLATYNKYFGQRVNAGFQGKVEFKAAGLQNCSILIRTVTEQDEGCYRCLFNTYPEGAFTGATCLQMYELHGPILHLGESKSAEKAVVSCSATGRPAPTVTLSVLPHDVHFSDHSSVSVTNTNGTVTVTTTAVLSRFHDSSTQVRCAVRVLSGPQREVFMTAPSADGVFEQSRSDFNFTVIIASVVAFGCVAAIIIVLCIRRRWNSLSNRDSEEVKTPQKPIQHTPIIKTPLIQREEEHVRLRMSTGKNKKSDYPKKSFSTANCNRSLF